jgi:hypothetical protein
MNTNKPDKNNKLVHLTPSVSLETVTPKKGCTKKRVRNKAEGHIEPYRSSGRIFYRYRRGRDKPVYLGTAKQILKAVVNERNQKRSK